MAAAVLLLRPEALAGSVLLRAMVPLMDPPQVDLHDEPILGKPMDVRNPDSSRLERPEQKNELPRFQLS